MAPVNWQQALLQTIQEWANKKILFGHSDCAQMAARYVEILTGENLADKVFGNYAGHKEAENIITERGGLMGVATACQGEPDKTDIQPGDIAVLDTEPDQTVGIYNGSYFFTVDISKQEVLRCAVQPELVLAHWSIS